MIARRLAPAHDAELDASDPSILWYTRGGDYQVMMST
jgi:hypothetical protein